MPTQIERAARAAACRRAKGGVRVSDNPKLTDACPICKLERGNYRCEECKGDGIVPSEFGEALLDFIWRYRSRIFSDD